ncbi:MAG: phosphate ABC transporter ATP-binding protein [Chloroflexota bacterium]|nr:MAG: phosphate ABC transporter ATP-binding protein [Chloroflexota bacterium]
MRETLFQLRAVRKEYAARNVLQIDTLDIFNGEILALVGPSGAGKSTLLRLLNFLEQPTSGEMNYRGIARENISLDVRREITTVFQRPVLLNTNVRANIAYGLELRGARNDAAVDEILARVGLQSLAHASARKLSGGEMQRVALARALVIEPRVLLLDEPTANLDPYNVGLIEEIVREQYRTHGTTIVVVTHNLFQAKRLAQRVGLMLNGQVIEIADAPVFFESPRDPRTAAFVKGEMIY